MKTLEFKTKIKRDRKITLPDKFNSEFENERDARVIILLDDDEKKEWQKIVYDNFLNGYSDADAVYDKL